MRNRFEPQLSIGQRPIEQTPISLKCKDALEELLAALKYIYCYEEYNNKVFNALNTITPKFLPKYVVSIKTLTMLANVV